MSEQKLHGVPFTTDFPVEPVGELKALIKEEKAEIEAFGIGVTGIHLLGEGAPPRYFIQFPKGAGSFTFRSKLEANDYDVGQQMGKDMLKFYASRRKKKGKGWEVSVGDGVSRSRAPSDGGYSRKTVSLPTDLVKRIEIHLANTPGLTLSAFISIAGEDKIQRIERRKITK